MREEVIFDVSCGQSHVLILKQSESSQQVVACGLNDKGNKSSFFLFSVFHWTKPFSKGQLGLSDFVNRTSFELVTKGEVKGISCGSSFSTILRRDGVLLAFGSGPFDVEDRSKPNQITKDENIRKVICASKEILLLMEDGEIVQSLYGGLVQIDKDRSVKIVISFKFHFLFP